jgi:endonuclease G
MQIKLFLTSLLFPLLLFAQPDIKVDKKYYQVTYSQKYKQPLTVDYGFRNRECNATRSGMDFYTEKTVITSSNIDYVENEWDKGHMAPAADFCYSRDAMWATFSYTNCALQHYKLNRGVWKQLETAERDWAKKDSIIVHIDVLFDPNSKPLPSGATIPKSFRKTITFYSTGKKLVYEFPNIPPTQPLDKYLIKGKL